MCPVARIGTSSTGSSFAIDQGSASVRLHQSAARLPSSAAGSSIGRLGASIRLGTAAHRSIASELMILATDTCSGSLQPPQLPAAMAQKRALISLSDKTDLDVLVKVCDTSRGADRVSLDLISMHGCKGHGRWRGGPATVRGAARLRCLRCASYWPPLLPAPSGPARRRL